MKYAKERLYMSFKWGIQLYYVHIFKKALGGVYTKDYELPFFVAS